MAVLTRSEMRARQVAQTKQPNTFWPWFIQRVTGAALVPLLAIHIVVNHFGNINVAGVREREREMIVFSDVAHRLTFWWWWAIDLALLGFILYHGLNGIRNIALDLGVKSTGDRVVTGLLTLIGAVSFVFGVAALIAFRRYA